MLRLLALALTIAVAFSGEVNGQSETPSRKQNTAPAEQQPTSEQRGTEQAPFVVKIQQPEQTQTKSRTGPEQRPEQGSNSWFAGWNLSDRIAGIASAAAFLQFLALIATVWIMVRNGRRQLRAYVFPEEISVIDGSMLNPPQQNRINVPGVIVAFRNSGQTPAYHVISWTDIAVTDVSKENTLSAPRPLKDVFPTWIGANGKMPKAVWFNRVLTAQESRTSGRENCSSMSTAESNTEMLSSGSEVPISVLFMAVCSRHPLA